MSEELVMPKEKKKLSKGKLIAILILVAAIAVAAVAGVLYMKWYNSPEQKYQRALESGNDDAAEQIISEYAPME